MDTSPRYGLVAIAASAGGITPSPSPPGAVDYVLPLDRIGAKLVELLDHHAGLTPTGATS